jgi:agmatinase
MVAREGICGMEVVEIAPPYDVSDMTAQLGARAIMDVLGTMVEEGHLGSRPSRQEREQREHEEREAKASEEES